MASVTLSLLFVLVGSGPGYFSEGEFQLLVRQCKKHLTRQLTLRSPLCLLVLPREDVGRTSKLGKKRLVLASVPKEPLGSSFKRLVPRPQSQS